jgi:hypothetical protein
MHGRIVFMQRGLSISALSKGTPARTISWVRWQGLLAAIVLRRPDEVLHYYQSPAMVGQTRQPVLETILC